MIERAVERVRVGAAIGTAYLSTGVAYLSSGLAKLGVVSHGYACGRHMDAIDAHELCHDWNGTTRHIEQMALEVELQKAWELTEELRLRERRFGPLPADEVNQMKAESTVRLSGSK